MACSNCCLIASGYLEALLQQLRMCCMAPSQRGDALMSKIGGCASGVADNAGNPALVAGGVAILAST